ncbi:unnamed protein product [Brachionus calyciflorus]|uniref:M-phase phosphoprotein 6 n=1 Tax=Brachionus calyciflorus TaxID=104777 RepID=A0A814GWD7_9BILA|nr:unnamed protein product [Brachionus calyciflorus]
MKSKVNLSSNVLQMKFMKRTAVEKQEELALEEQKHQIDNEHWYLDVDTEKKVATSGCSVIVEPSYTVFDGIGFGRMSFNGFNPQVEKIMKQINGEVEEKDDKEEKEIDDEEMAEHYSSSLGNTIGKKLGKRFFKMPQQPKAKRLAT